LDIGANTSASKPQIYINTTVPSLHPSLLSENDKTFIAEK